MSGGRQDPRAALSLEGRVALVTGASRGIGRAVAVALAAAGATVACIARSLEQAETAAAEIRADGGRAQAFRMDVTRSADVDTQAGVIASTLGPIDVLVNNAGTILQRKTVEMTDEEWETILATNLSSMFRCARAVAPSMIARRRGKIINIGSMWGKLGVPQFAAYCATKAGAEALTRCLAVEWARHNIQVNCLAPGYIRTDFSREAMQEDRTRDLVLSKIPLRRLGEPEEMGPLAVYLASSASDFMTGQTVYIDGGQTITW